MKLELVEKLQVASEKEYYIAIPNEYFSLLKQWKDEKIIKSPSHIPFTWSYIVFTAYMYRYGRYGTWMAKQGDIKELLGYASNYKPIDYIIKKDGVLDTNNITETTTDIAIGFNWEDSTFSFNDKLDYVEIVTLSNFKSDFGDVDWYRQQVGLSRRQTMKLPKFAYYRNVEEYQDEYIDVEEYDGTFYDSKNTTLVDIRILDFCMKHEDLGCTGFYLYYYLKHKNDIFGGYDASVNRLADELGLSKNTIQTYRDALRSHDMILLKHNMDYYHPQMKKEDKKVSTNITYGFEQFKDDPIEYVKFSDKEKRQQLELEENVNKVLNDELYNKPIHVDLSDLPF